MARLWASESAQQARATPRKAPAAAANATNGTNVTNGKNAGAAAGVWQARIGKVAIDGGSARVADYQPAEANRGRPVIHQFRNIALSTGAIAWPLTPAAVPVKLHAESGRRGVIGIDGTILPAMPASRPAASLNTALQDLRQQHPERWRRLGQAALGYRLADPFAGQPLGPVRRAMEEQARHFADAEPAFGRPFDQSEKRPELRFSGHQCCKAGAQQNRLAADREAGLAARGIGNAHAAATAPELSRFSA